MMTYSGSTSINLDNPSYLPFFFSAHALPLLHCLPPRAQNQEKSSHWKEKHRSVTRSRWEEQSVGVGHLLGRPGQCQLQYLPGKHLFGGFYLSFSCYISEEIFYETFLFYYSSFEVETALHEKYSLIPPEYVEDGVETARRMSIERRWASVHLFCHFAFLVDPCLTIASPCQLILMLMLWRHNMMKMPFKSCFCFW